MGESSTASMTKPEAYEAFREGDLSEEEAIAFFGAEEWEEVRQLERVEEILADQPDPDTDPHTDPHTDPDTDPDDLYR